MSTTWTHFWYTYKHVSDLTYYLAIFELSSQWVHNFNHLWPNMLDTQAMKTKKTKRVLHMYINKNVKIECLLFKLTCTCISNNISAKVLFLHIKFSFKDAMVWRVYNAVNKLSLCKFFFYWAIENPTKRDITTIYV